MATCEELAVRLTKALKRGPWHVARWREQGAFTGCDLFRAEPVGGDQQSKFFIKCSSGDERIRLAMAPFNKNEVAFFNGPARVVQGVAPDCLIGEYQERNGQSTLVLEWLETRNSVSFRDGCSAGHAGLVIEAIASIHCTSHAIERSGHVTQDEVLAHINFPQIWEGYARSLGDVLPGVTLCPRLVALGDAVAAEPQMLAEIFDTGPAMILHRDLQLDNVLIEQKAGFDLARLVDWQFWGIGPGGLDLGYFILSSLSPEVRRQCEKALISRYCELMSEQFPYYGPDEVRRDVRRATIWKLVVSVFATQMMDNSSPQKRQWRKVDLERLTQFVRDHEITIADLA